MKVDSINAKECPNCKTLVGLDVFACTMPGCGFEWEKPRFQHEAQADPEAIIMTGQRSSAPPIKDPWLKVTGIHFGKHYKRADPNAPPTLRVDYDCGFKGYSEWVCFEHTGVARAKAEKWWRDMRGQAPTPSTIDEALSRCEDREVATPSDIVTKQDGQYVRVVGRRFDPAELERVRAFVRVESVARETASWWQVLDVSPDAELEEVKSAFRRKAREHHPDLGGDHAVMANINRAYQQAMDLVDIPF